MTLFCVFTTHTGVPLIRIVAVVSPGLVVTVVTSPGLVVTVHGVPFFSRKCPSAHNTLIPRALCRV